MIIVSFKNSVFRFYNELNGIAPAIITAAMIEKALSITWKIKWFLNTTTITAIKNLLNKKYMGCISEIEPASILRSSKIGENYTVKSAILFGFFQLWLNKSRVNKG